MPAHGASTVVREVAVVSARMSRCRVGPDSIVNNYQLCDNPTSISESFTLW